jgi:hypothetical protein
MIICDIIAAFMALLWLKPLAKSVVRRSEQTEILSDIRTPIKARGVA